MTSVDAILEAAKKDFLNGQYFLAIYPLENYLNEDKGDDAFLAVNVALYVIYEFREREDLRISVLESLKSRGKWKIEDLNIKIAQEFLTYGGHINFQTKARVNAEKYCDKNLTAGIESFDTYYFKACARKDDVNHWLYFFDLALGKDLDEIERVLGQIYRWYTWQNDTTTVKKVLRWLQNFPNEILLVRALKARCLEEIGDIDSAIELYVSLQDTDLGEQTEYRLVELYRRNGQYKKAISIAEKRENPQTNELIKLYLTTGKFKKAKVLFNQKYPRLGEYHSRIFLDFGLFDEALETLNNAMHPLDEYNLYNKVRAFFGKYWLRNGDLNSFVNETLPLSAYGRELCNQRSRSGKDTSMPHMVALFYMMEARIYFLLNLNFLKRERKSLQEAKFNDNLDFNDRIFNYVHRNRVDEIYKKFNDNLFAPVSMQVDFRLKDYKYSFERAIRILDRVYKELCDESEQQNVLALENKESLSTNEMWYLYGSYFKSDKYEACREVLSLIEEKQSGHPNVYQEKGRVAFRLREYDTAISCLEKAILQFEKYTERAASAHNLLQQVYSSMVEDNNLTPERKSDIVDQLNHSFETWFKSDIEIFTNVEDTLPVFGPRYNDSITTLQGQTIYKYYAFNINCVSALSDEKIYFSTPQQLNDPFDMDGYLETINEKEFSHVSDEVKNKVSCFCSTLKNDNLQMWAHYADSFKGICIGYKIKKLPKDIAWRKLLYPNDKRADRALIDRLFIKSKNWAYEEEIRFLKFSQSPQLVTVSPSETQPGIDGCISEIVLGSRFDISKNGPVLRAVLKQINNKYEQKGIDPIEIFQAHENKAGKSDSLDIQPASIL